MKLNLSLTGSMRPRLCSDPANFVVGAAMLVTEMTHSRSTNRLARGLEVGEVQTFDRGAFVFFADPDRNRRPVQQLPPRD